MPAFRTASLPVLRAQTAQPQHHTTWVQVLCKLCSSPPTCSASVWSTSLGQPPSTWFMPRLTVTTAVVLTCSRGRSSEDQWLSSRGQAVGGAHPSAQRTSCSDMSAAACTAAEV